MASPCARYVRSLCSIHYPTATVVPSRNSRYHKWGGMKKGKKIPLEWRKIDHNPANIPSAWIPDDWKEKNTINYEREKEMAEYIPGYQPKIPNHEHPDYHNETLFSFNPDTKLVEGFQQALNLTKSILMKNMPEKIQELEEIAEIPNQDDRVVEIFRLANMFDINPENYDMKSIKRRSHTDNFKIFSTIQRYCPLILDNLIRLCSLHPYSIGQLSSRMQAHNVECTTYARRICELNPKMSNFTDCEWLISLKSSGVIQTLSKTQLPPFASEKEIKNTSEIPLPDISPVLPIVDLKKTNIYRNDVTCGLSESAPLPHIHTLYLQNMDDLTSEEMLAQMTCQIFACLHSRALLKYGSEPNDLPKPICGQVIATDGQNFHFLCMQLNTTKLDSDFGVKNMVWTNSPGFDTPLGKKYLPLRLYETCSHREWQNPGYYTGYDPNVFRSFLALWLNGTV